MAVLLNPYQTTVGAGTKTLHNSQSPSGSTAGAIANVTFKGGNMIGTVPGWSDRKINHRSAAVFELSVTAGTSAGTDTLNAYLQYTLDGGVSWQDFASFVQVLGNGTFPLASYLQYATDQTTTGATVTHSDGALAAGTVVKGPIGSPWRVKLVQAGTTAQFTVAVYVGH